MSKEHRFIFNNTIVIVEEPYKNDKGCVLFGRKLYDEVEILFSSHDKALVEFFIKLQKYIIDLEVKIAEKDQAIEGLQEINKSLGLTCNNDAKEIERLREQLADQEKELNYFKGTKLGDFAEEIRNLKQSQNQTAIAELEKVKEKIYKRLKNQKDNVYAQYDYQVFKPVIEFIDQQITQRREVV